MEEKELLKQKEKFQKVCKISLIATVCLAVVFMGLMIAFLLTKKSNTTVATVLLIVCAVFVLLVFCALLTYYFNKKKADNIQAQIDQE